MCNITVTIAYQKLTRSSLTNLNVVIKKYPNIINVQIDNNPT